MNKTLIALSTDLVADTCHETIKRWERGGKERLKAVEERKAFNQLVDRAPKTKGIWWWKRPTFREERVAWATKTWAANSYLREVFEVQYAMRRTLDDHAKKIDELRNLRAAMLESPSGSVAYVDATLWEYATRRI